jgi:hypothetical protein
MSEATAAEVAIPLDALMAYLGQHCLNPRALRLLEDDEESRAFTCRCIMVHYCHDFATSTLNTPISLGALRPFLVRNWVLVGFLSTNESIAVPQKPPNVPSN